MKTTFRIYHDTQPNEAVDELIGALAQVKANVEVTELDGGDGYMEYEVEAFHPIAEGEDQAVS